MYKKINNYIYICGKIYRYAGEGGKEGERKRASRHPPRA